MPKNNKSSVDLILLGLLRNQVMSAYDLSKIQGIYELVKISVPAIYKNIKRLEVAGYLKYKLKKMGKMPGKRIYSITKKGEKRFQELLVLCSENQISFFFDFNVPLLFVNSIVKENGNKIIALVRQQLEEKHNYLLQQADKYNFLPFPILNLAIQQLKLNKMLIDWLKEFSKEYNK